jgi:hypothetical protein
VSRDFWLRVSLPVWLLLAPMQAQWHPQPESKRIKFSGYEWIVKDSGGTRVDPGHNYFSEDAVQVAAGRLRLRVFEKEGSFYCAELVSVKNLGYGTYRFQVKSNVDRLASNLTLGFFSWQDDPGEEKTHKEIDVEIGKWGKPDYDNAQFVVQPYSRPENIVRFSLPRDATSSTHAFTWTHNKVHFTSKVGGIVVQDHVFTHGIPEADKQHFRINLWIADGHKPSEDALEVSISNFKFEPERKQDPRERAPRR